MTRKDTVWQDKDLVASFLSGVRGAIPLAAEQIDVILRMIEGFRGDSVTSFLDLGCGDGVLARAVLSKYPDAQAVLYDFSQPMLDAARESLNSDKTIVIQGDYAPVEWVESLAPYVPFDVIVSGYSIHHQPDDIKKRLYQQIYDMLKPGGIFLNLEHVSSPTTDIEHVYDEMFVDSMVAYFHANGSTDSRQAIADKHYYRPDKEANILAPVEDQCEWLRDIGYTHVDCYFKVFELALFGGVKP